MDLIEEVKNRLNVTWDYDDEKIKNIMIEGEEFIIARVGKTNFKTEISAKKLLKEYCFYAWNGALFSFEDDFKSDILNLQLRHSLN